MTRIAIVDDHPVVADGLAASLAQEFEVAWRATSVEEAAVLVASDPPDVVIVDVRLGARSGLDLLPGRERSGPRYVVISSFDRPQYAKASFERGARGFLLKTAPLDVIAVAIRSVAAGGTAFDARHLDAVQSADQLSRRERDVVQLVAQGQSNDEIALELGIARKTVEAYLTRLFERWNVRTRTELALRAERDGRLEA